MVNQQNNLYIYFLDEVKIQMIEMPAARFILTCSKDWQLNAIQVVVRGEDALVVQPTGSGKAYATSFLHYGLRRALLSLLIL